jgi:hypothetical protein
VGLDALQMVLDGLEMGLDWPRMKLDGLWQGVGVLREPQSCLKTVVVRYSGTTLGLAVTL